MGVGRKRKHLEMSGLNLEGEFLITHELTFNKNYRSGVFQESSLQMMILQAPLMTFCPWRISQFVRNTRVPVPGSGKKNGASRAMALLVIKVGRCFRSSRFLKFLYSLGGTRTSKALDLTQSFPLDALTSYSCVRYCCGLERSVPSKG